MGDDCVLSADFTEIKKKRRNKRTTTADPASPSASNETSDSNQEHIFSDIFSSVLSQSSVGQNNQQQLSKAAAGNCVDADAADVATRFSGLVREQQQQQKELSIARAKIDSLSAQSNEVHELMTQLKQQQEKVAALITQVSFILSFLGITTSSSASVAAKKNGSGHADQTTQAEVEREAAPTSQKAPSSVQCNLKNVMRQTIHQENKMEARRAKTIIISGLEATSGLSDQDAAAKLLRVELDARPQIVFCKRLGRSAEGRVQPLLVALSRVEDAAWIVANAKQLRDSHVRAIRDNVYINANLTKEQSQEAYSQRCKRRAAAQQRDRQQSTAETTSPARGSRIVRNSNRATEVRNTTKPKSSQDSMQRLDDQSSIKLVYRAQQPSAAGNNSSSSLQSGAEVAAMEYSISGEPTSDQIELPKHHQYSTASTNNLTVFGQNVDDAAILTTQHQQKSSSSTLNPTAANFVSSGEGAAGSCATAATA